MSTVFIHTADWQIGKPFGTIEDNEKRVLLQQERINAIGRIGQIAKERKAQFIVVAGDLFDSTTPSKQTVSATLSAIGQLEIPVYVIPGNHDHGGAGGLWTQEYYKSEKKQLASNLHVLLDPQTVLEIDEAYLFPCPLLRRHELNDLTAWLRNFDYKALGNPNKPRIGIAHGTVKAFEKQLLDDEEGTPVNFLNLDMIGHQELDYIALGDWHGTKQISERVWYSGTHETDRWRGSEYDPGNVLVVTVAHNSIPVVEKISSSGMNWGEFDFVFNADENVEHFEVQIQDVLGDRVYKDLYKLSLSGALGLKAQQRLENILESRKARLITLKIENNILLTPSKDELDNLVSNNPNPLISHVANRLVEMINGNTDEKELAETALRELYFTIHNLSNTP